MVDEPGEAVGCSPDVDARPELSHAVAEVGLGAVAGAGEGLGVVVAGLAGSAPDVALDVVEVEVGGDLVGVGEGVGGGA